jgi:hypothetical protein
MVIKSTRIHQNIISSLDSVYRYLRAVMYNRNRNALPFEVRKVQDSMRCLMIALPRRFTRLLNIGKGDLLKIQLESDTYKGNSLIITKVRLGEDY